MWHTTGRKSEVNKLLIVFTVHFQETSFAGNQAVTRKVSSTSVKSLPTKGTSQIVSVQRTSSEKTGPQTHVQPPPPKTIVPNSELSPWHVTSISANHKPQGVETTKAPPITQRRVITTELWSPAAICISQKSLCILYQTSFVLIYHLIASCILDQLVQCGSLSAIVNYTQVYFLSKVTSFMVF